MTLETALRSGFNFAVQYAQFAIKINDDCIVDVDCSFVEANFCLYLYHVHYV